jgi:hypothetical protein
MVSTCLLLQVIVAWRLPAWGRVHEQPSPDVHPLVFNCANCRPMHRDASHWAHLVLTALSLAGWRRHVSSLTIRAGCRWARFCESTGDLGRAAACYAASQDHLALVRLHTHSGNWRAADEVALESGDPAAAFHLARQYEAQDKVPEAIRHVSTRGCRGALGSTGQMSCWRSCSRVRCQAWAARTAREARAPADCCVSDSLPCLLISRL